MSLTPRAAIIIEDLALRAATTGEQIAPDDLILAFLEDQASVAGKILHGTGQAAAIARELAEVMSRPGDAKSSQRGLHKTVGRMTAAGRQVLEQAEADARHLGSSLIGTGQLLVAVMKVDDGVGSRILRAHGIDIAAVNEGLDTLPSEGIQEIRSSIRLTPRLEQLLERVKDAGRRGRPFATEKNLIVALVNDSEGLAGEILRRHGIDAVNVGSRIESASSMSEHEGTQRSAFDGLSLQAVIDSAAYEATQLRNHWIGAEHVLLALVNEPDGIMSRILAQLGLTPSVIQSEIADIIVTKESTKFPGYLEPWGSRVEHDEQGNPILNADGTLRQFIIDASGKPLRDSEGRRLCWQRGSDGAVVLDRDGNPKVVPLD